LQPVLASAQHADDVAVILDAWSRKVVGYAIARSIDVRLTLAALQSAVEKRRPPPGCIHHTDRGSQYAAGRYRQMLAQHGFVGSMGRRGNPYDNAKAESFMKTLKVEAVYPMAYESFADVAAGHTDVLADIHENDRKLVGCTEIGVNLVIFIEGGRIIFKLNSLTGEHYASIGIQPAITFVREHFMVCFANDELSF